VRIEVVINPLDIYLLDSIKASVPRLLS